jgi:hypothetical protein
MMEERTLEVYNHIKRREHKLLCDRTSTAAELFIGECIVLGILDCNEATLRNPTRYLKVTYYTYMRDLLDDYRICYPTLTYEILSFINLYPPL